MKFFFALITFLILGLGIIYKMNYSPVINTYDITRDDFGGDFTLQGIDGKVSLSDYRGKNVILYFGFATCPDVCPMSLSYLSKALKQMDAIDKIQVIFISVDHTRDTPKKVHNYAKFFNKNFIGVTGSEEEINKVTKQYEVYYKFIDMPESAMKYTVDHTSRFYILDKMGRAHKRVRSDETQELILKEIQNVLDKG